MTNKKATSPISTTNPPLKTTNNTFFQKKPIRTFLHANKEMIFQSILIFLSVFMGIVAGNWNETRKQQHKKEAFLQALLVEIKSNKTNVESYLKYHEVLAENFKCLMEEEDNINPQQTLAEFGGFMAFDGWRGVGISSIDNAVYQSGLTSSIFSDLPINLLTQISRNQSNREDYLQLIGNLMNKMIDIKQQDSVQNFFTIISVLAFEIPYLERIMLTEYTKIIDEIEQELNK